MSAEKNENQTEMVFKNQYNSLTRKQKKILRDKFLQVSGLSLPSFYNKMVCDGFKPLEKDLLIKLMKDL